MTLPPLSNAKLKAFAKLHDKKHRDEEQLFIAEGNRAVADILFRSNAASYLVALVFREDNNMFGMAEAFDGKSFTLSNSAFGRLANTETPQEMLAVLRQPVASFSESLSQLAAKEASLVVALDGLQDAGNVGAIVRTAAWFGADMVLASAETADFFNPKAVRSSAGSLFAVPLVRSQNFIQDLEALKKRGCAICASALDGEGATTENLPKKIGLVIGNEGRGVGDDVLKLADKTLTIIGNGIESLNAAVAAGILMSLYRQKHRFSP